MALLFGAFICGFVFSLVLMFLILPLLKKAKAGQEILSYVAAHSSKAGTPTMGGVAFILAALVASFIFFRDDSVLALLCCGITFAYATVGFLDDYIKVRFKRNLGLRAYQKIIMQLAVSFIVGFAAYNNKLVDGEFVVPFLNVTLNFGWWTVPVVVFVFLATTNGVNLTDGMDGLAASVTAVFMAFFGVLLFMTSNEMNLSGQIILSAEYQNLAVFSVAVTGSLIAYLLFNVFPAKVFMGDAGSLGLGGAAACVAVLSKNSLMIPLVGIMYVVSVVSVIVQVVSFKLRKKRVLLMSPYHHHLQMKGWSEPRIVMLYVSITLLFAAALLAV